MDDSTPNDTPYTELRPLAAAYVTRLELFRNAVLRRSANFAVVGISDEALLAEIDGRQDALMYLRTAALPLICADDDLSTPQLIEHLQAYAKEQILFRDLYRGLRTAVCQLLTRRPDVSTDTLISGIERMARDQVLPSDDVESDTSLHVLNSDLEAECHSLQVRLVHAMRAIHHLSAITLDIATEHHSDSGCSHG